MNSAIFRLASLFLVAILPLTRCAHSPSAKGRKVGSEDPKITLRWEKGRCFNENCPAFTFIVRDDGTTSCIGLKKVGIKGRFDAEIAEASVSQLIESLRESGFFEKLKPLDEFPAVKNKNAISYYLVTENDMPRHFWLEADSEESKVYESLFTDLESKIFWDPRNSKGKKRISCLRK